MAKDNYRVQDGCWNCGHAGHDIQGRFYYCMLTGKIDDVARAGICDRHEKEKKP